VKPGDLPASTLDPRVQDLVRMITDVSAMNALLMEYDIDVTKMPLGKLSKKQLNKGFAILQTIDYLLKSAHVSKSKFIDCSNQFYTLIPHAVGMKAPPVINNKHILKEKLALLTALGDIEVAFKMVNKSDGVEHPIDSNYKKLRCRMRTVARDEAVFDVVTTYMKQTHAPTHTEYRLELVDLFEVEREGESQRFAPFANDENRQLLWHGSRTTNFSGIIGQGLRIAPPEAPVTGYMFNKGVYFADSSSKSANYCHATKKNPYGVMLLCEVALGKMLPLLRAKETLQLPDGHLAAFGVGERTPDPNAAYTLPSGCVVPLGKLVHSGVKKGFNDGETDLLYNEYVVYNTAQIFMRYMLKVRFVFK